MKKRNHLFKATVLVAVLTLLIVSAAATAFQPYGSYYTTINDGTFTDTATSCIYKCNCVPVNNWLLASVQTQYKEGNQYKWDPENQTYYYNEGTNIASVSKSVKHATITYAGGWFQARCGNGGVHGYYASATI